MKELKHPAKPLFQNESDVDVTIFSNEEPDEEDYHTCIEILASQNLGEALIVCFSVEIEENGSVPRISKCLITSILNLYIKL